MCRLPLILGFAGLAIFGPLVSSLSAANPNILLSDFESDNYQDWIAEGNAFSPGPQNPDKLYLNRHGQHLAMSRTEFGGDSATGTLTSPPFIANRKYLFFLIGGGNHPDEVYVELLLDGQAVETQPGLSSKSLEPIFWNLDKYAGKTLQIRLVDEKQGQWGHIAADFFVLTDEMAEPSTFITLDEAKSN